MDALELFTTRRSTRSFTDEPVDEGQLAQLIEAAQHAPSGGNSQTTRLIVIRSRAVLGQLTELVERTFAQMEEVPGMYRSLASSIRKSKAGGYVFHYGAPVLVLACNKCDYGNAMADSACALENLMLMANALDLGSCWINQLHWLTDEPAVHDALLELGMQPDETCCGAVAVGHAATEDGLPNRVPLPRTGNPVVFVD